MSIIYNTLERIEADNPPLAYNKDKVNSLRLTVEPRGLPVKTVAIAVAVVIAGANLMLWQRIDEAAAPQYLAMDEAAEQIVASKKPEYELIPLLIGEQSTVPMASNEPNSETSMERDAPSAMPALTDSVAVNSEQRVAVKEEPLVLDAIEEVIKQARIALSRGRYEQALSTLETLERVPENRADFWLIKGSAHLGLAQLDPAEMAFASAQVLAPDNAQIAVQQAVLKQEKGDHASALRILKTAAISHPNVPEIFLNQGYSQQALGSERDARRSFRSFLQMTESRSLYLQQRKVVEEWLAQE
jgi:tetratricopeptide (TPR) repeat protein